MGRVRRPRARGVGAFLLQRLSGHRLARGHLSRAGRQPPRVLRALQCRQILRRLDFRAPRPCMLKSEAISDKVPTKNYTSGCRDDACSAPPIPFHLLRGPSPAEQVCHVGTVCNAAYAVNKLGCCPYANATCCANNQACCPSGSTCFDSGVYGTVCKPAPGASPLPPDERLGKSVCKSGAALPPSKTLPNVLIIGDSVSIGYTPYVAKRMSGVAFVQHSPYDVTDGAQKRPRTGSSAWTTFCDHPRVSNSIQT